MAACSVYGPAGLAELLGPGQGGLAPVDVEAVPRAAILVEQQDGRARRAGAGAQAGRLELHQRDEPVDLGLLRREGGEHAAERGALRRRARAAASRRPEVAEYPSL